MKILMVLTSHDQLGNTGRKTGFWLEEFAAPYYVFQDAGVKLTLASPRDGLKRGSQVSFRHENGYAIMQALIARGVIGDFRAPDAIRFGFTPLYIGETEVRAAVDVIDDVMTNRRWDTPEYRKMAVVT